MEPEVIFGAKEADSLHQELSHRQSEKSIAEKEITQDEIQVQATD